MKSNIERFRKCLKTGRRIFCHVGKCLTDLLYPPRCPFCEEILSEEERGMLACASCCEKLNYVDADYCMKCGRKLLTGREEYCRDCGKRKHFFIQGRSVFVYATPVKQSLYRMKNGRQEYAHFYGKEMERILGKWIQRCRIEVILPVPVHARKKRIRGYNQAELLARELGQRMELPVAGNLLVKRKHTQAQKSLDAAGRRDNLKGAFGVEYQFEGERILLVDDIYTTGATVDMAAEALRKAGAGEVYVVTAAIGSQS